MMTWKTNCSVSKGMQLGHLPEYIPLVDATTGEFGDSDEQVVFTHIQGVPFLILVIVVDVLVWPLQ
jgi:hypothetical protein